MTIKFSDINRFLAEKMVTNICHSCGNDKYYVTEPIESTNGTVTGIIPNMHMGGQYHNGVEITSIAEFVIHMECTNCGYIRLYSYKAIAKWAADNPESTEGV